MRRAALALALVASACSKPSGTAAREVTGTLTIDGKSVAVTACRPAHAVHTYLVLQTAQGALRFENGVLSWNDDPSSPSAGEQLSCDRLDRSWGGGVRPDATAYWRGKLAFTCKAGPRTFVGELTADCGQITAEERAQLDHGRADLLDQQRGSSAP